MAHKHDTVLGVAAPGPRVTARALVLLVLYLGLPLLGALVALDVLVWFVVKYVWGACYGLWCWL